MRRFSALSILGEDAILVSSVSETLPVKNFGEEVRSRLDVKHFLDDSVVLLDAMEDDLDVLVHR